MLRFIIIFGAIYCGCLAASSGEYLSQTAETYGIKGGDADFTAYKIPSSMIQQQQMNGNGYGSSEGQVVQAAVNTKHNIEFRDVPTTGHLIPTTIEVGANAIPINILFRSASSSLNIQQAHDGAQGTVQESSSEDEPHRLIHSVKKPIIQEVHEVITPYRKITQEIQPVQEEILTIVARNKEQQQENNNGKYSVQKKESLNGKFSYNTGSGTETSTPSRGGY